MTMCGKGRAPWYLGASERPRVPTLLRIQSEIGTNLVEIQHVEHSSDAPGQAKCGLPPENTKYPASGRGRFLTQGWPSGAPKLRHLAYRRGACDGPSGSSSSW